LSNTPHITLLGAGLPLLPVSGDLMLREGAEVVVRVLMAPAGGGRGLLSLGGRRLPAELPAGLVPGQKLRVTVEAQSAERLALRVLRDSEGEMGPSPLERLASFLAVSGDASQLRVALELAGSGVLPLPGGAAGSIRVDADEQADAAQGEGVSRARVTIHSPELGSIDIALTLGPGGLAAAVDVEPGEPSELAKSAERELTTALERAVGRAASVSIAPREPTAPRPSPPVDLDWVDVRA
jgi:hypothetical protein